MGLALELILASKQGLTGGGTFDDLTPQGGATFTVRNSVEGSRILLEESWAVDDTDFAQLSIKSPNFHDNIRGLLLSVPSGGASGANADEPNILFPGPVALPLEPSDTFTVQAASAGGGGDNLNACFLVRYENLRGADAQFLDWPSVFARMRQPVGILVQPAPGAGTYGTPVAINSVDTRLKSGHDYAILGAIPSSPVTAITFTAPETSNYRIGMPGTVDPVAGADYFVRLSQKYNVPHIPWFSGTDQGNVLIEAVDVGTGTTPDVTVVLAQIS